MGEKAPQYEQHYTSAVEAAAHVADQAAQEWAKTAAELRSKK